MSNSMDVTVLIRLRRWMPHLPKEMLIRLKHFAFAARSLGCDRRMWGARGSHPTSSEKAIEWTSGACETEVARLSKFRPRCLVCADESHHATHDVERSAPRIQPTSTVPEVKG
jgi:hypothetical protein